MRRGWVRVSVSSRLDDMCWAQVVGGNGGRCQARRVTPVGLCRRARLLRYSLQVSQTSAMSNSISAVSPAEKCIAAIR